MSRTLIEALLSQLDTAFEGDAEHSLLANLRNVGEDDWTWRPPGADGRDGRSIHEIVWHVGACKYLYEHHAFGAATMRFDDPLVAKPAAPRPMAEMLEWAHDGHHRLIDGVRALDDDSELESQRPTNWGERMVTRRIIEIMVMHDLYHAGEINHLRTQRQGGDRWAWER